METDSATILYNLAWKLKEEYPGFELFLNQNMQKLILQVHTRNQNNCGDWKSTLLVMTLFEKGVLNIDLSGIGGRNAMFEFDLCDPKSLDQVFEKIHENIPRNPTVCIDKLLQHWSDTFLGCKEVSASWRNFLGNTPDFTL
jgi:hypothetical protein